MINSIWTPQKYSRRDWLSRSGAAFALLALADLLSAAETLAPASASPNAVRPPHFPARAKRVIFLYMPGGPSHVDLFDPKPRLLQDNGKPLPFEKPKLERTKTGNLLASPWKFSRHGQSGVEVSELLPGMASCIDEICVIGGGEVFLEFLPRASRIYLSEVDLAPVGDIFFPAIDPLGWREVSRESFEAGPRDEAGFTLRVLDRISPVNHG